MAIELEVEIVDRQRAQRLDLASLRRFARALVRAKPARRVERMAVCLISDRAMSGYNLRFRGKRGTTDVLAFPADGAPDPGGSRYLGDIAISVPRAQRQAREAGHPLAREVRILLLHGYLHLLGYDHETDDGTMMRVQRRLERVLLAGRVR
jgi:probable rRNA maturation factor